MTPERELWSLVEPVHAITYFAPPVSGCLDGIGLHGFWNGYFAGRAAPMGAVGPGPVTATFFGFAPAMVEKAVPKVWRRVDPARALETKLAAAGAYLEPLLADLDPDAVQRADGVLSDAAASAATDGRALAAAWQSVDVPKDRAARLWWATTVIREHRGDGHVLAAAYAGLSGLETMLTHVASGTVTRETMQPNRGWTDTEWEGATEALRSRGLLTPDGTLTARGVALREEIEAATDRMAAPVHARISDDPAVREVLGRLGRTVAGAGHLPTGNPMGVPFPDGGDVTKA